MTWTGKSPVGKTGFSPVPDAFKVDALPLGLRGCPLPPPPFPPPPPTKNKRKKMQRKKTGVENLNTSIELTTTVLSLYRLGHSNSCMPLVLSVPFSQLPHLPVPTPSPQPSPPPPPPPPQRHGLLMYWQYSGRSYVFENVFVGAFNEQVEKK